MEHTTEQLSKRERILTWIAAAHFYKRSQGPVLLSELREGMGKQFDEQAFDDLARDGVIAPEFPDAKLGDSGRQFWNFAHWTAVA